MSVDSQLITAQGFYSVCLSVSLSIRSSMLQELLDSLLPTGHNGREGVDGTVTGSAQRFPMVKLVTA
jgi:hypothetical protein